jgi:peptidoglycan L-alanyl-D-glutamate endopeptidase CwlK
MKLPPSSLEKLKGVHPDLVRVVMKAAELTDLPFIVVEGKRDLARQKKLLAAGATTLLKSRHLTGHAVDLVPILDGKPRWDWPLYLKLAVTMRAAAQALNIPIRWGGIWEIINPTKGAFTTAMLSKKFPDGPHFELPRAVYPA